MKQFLILLIYYVVFSTLLSCSRIEATIVSQDVPYVLPSKGTIDETTRFFESVLMDDGYYHDKPLNIGVQNVVKRVDQFMNAEWIPLTQVPRYPDGYYESGSLVKGIPYSFGAEADGVVGIDISLDTFMTATENPYSYYYSEDIRKEPYTEILAGPFFGVVCSAAVAFFLGADFPYVTYLLDSCPWLVRLPNQEPDQIRVGDVIWRENHVMLIYDIARDKDGRIKKVMIAEGTSPVTRCFSLWYNEYIKRWNEQSWIIYCYTKIGDTHYQPCKYDSLKGDNFYDNSPVICTVRGDEVCFKEGERVIINTIKESSCNVMVYKDEQLKGEYQTHDHYLDLGALEYGDYVVSIEGLSDSLQSTRFSVVNYDVDLSSFVDGHIKVSFSSANGTACYIAFCYSNYRFISVYPLSIEDVKRGYALLPKTEDDCYCRVFFNGKYGRISSKLQHIPS